MRYKADELSYERIRIFGVTGFFTNERIQRDSVPEGLYQYEVRHDDCCQGIPCEAAKGILVNFWGTLLTLSELPVVGKNGYQYIEEEDWCDDCIQNFSLDDILREGVRKNEKM